MAYGTTPRARGKRRTNRCQFRPCRNNREASMADFSPRTRGWPPWAPHNYVGGTFPRARGVVPGMFEVSNAGSSFPSARGVVPQAKTILLGLLYFSPRTRGCSHVPCPPARRTPFPAHAGLFPTQCSRLNILEPLSPLMRGFPHLPASRGVSQLGTCHHLLAHRCCRARVRRVSVYLVHKLEVGSTP